MSKKWRFKKKLLCVIPASQQCDLGIWSRSLCLDKGLKYGTMIDLIETCFNDTEMGICIFNFGSLEIVKKKTILQAVEVLWDENIHHSSAKDIYFLGLEWGCEVIIDLLEKKFASNYKGKSRISGAAFIESAPLSKKKQVSKELSLFLNDKVLNWYFLKIPHAINPNARYHANLDRLSFTEKEKRIFGCYSIVAGNNI